MEFVAILKNRFPITFSCLLKYLLLFQYQYAQNTIFQSQALFVQSIRRSWALVALRCWSKDLRTSIKQASSRELGGNPQYRKACIGHAAPYSFASLIAELIRSFSGSSPSAKQNQQACSNKIKGALPLQHWRSSGQVESMCVVMVKNCINGWGNWLGYNKYQMNFSYNIPAQFSSPEEVALYFNSLCFQYDYPPVLLQQNQNVFPGLGLQFSYISQFPQVGKQDLASERPTDDMESLRDCEARQAELMIKIQQNPSAHNIYNTTEGQLQKHQPCNEEVAKLSKEKNLKKNTESNLINNIFSFICCESKSHSAVASLFRGNQDKMRIFYIFANNFKRINSKYLNRKNIKSICEIVPKQQHFKMLSKSIKRLLVLPMKELRVAFRKLIFHYLRGSESVLPLLTSKKICKVATNEHMNRRRDLAKYLQISVKDYS